jgi:hypothetical protein
MCVSPIKKPLEGAGTNWVEVPMEAVGAAGCDPISCPPFPLGVRIQGFASPRDIAREGALVASCGVAATPSSTTTPTNH